jgi:gamma-glutamylputrescine oxidase
VKASYWILNAISARASWIGISETTRIQDCQDRLAGSAMSVIVNQEHTDSYYAACQRDTSPFPALGEDISADVCIVGGGLTGVAAAVEFTERGYNTVLVEANRIGWGASGRNGGQIIGGYGGALSYTDKLNTKLPAEQRSALRQMGIECVDIIRERVAKYEIDCDLQWGYLDVALKPAEMRDLQASYESAKQENHADHLKLINAREVRDYLGTEKYIGGLVNESWGHLHVLDYCKGQARAAEKLGGRIFEHSLVTSIEEGEQVRVLTANGSITAKKVVLCGNAYLAKFAPKLAPKLSPLILPATSYIIATEPLSDDLAQDVMPKNYATCDQRWALDYFRMTADKRMLFGGLSNYAATAPKSVIKTLRKKMLTVFPQLENAAIDFSWGGHLGISFRRIPQLGQIHPNVYYSQAYSGHGVAPTHMSARLLAEAVDGDNSRFDIISKNRHIPFPGFGLIRQSMYAVGMSFYKLMDELK